jgi:hypothetical protein
MIANEIEVELIKQVVGAVAATEAGDHARAFIGEGRMQIGQALCGRAGKIKWSLLEGVVAESGNETECAKTIYAFFRTLKFGRGRRSHHADARARVNGWWP